MAFIALGGAAFGGAAFACGEDLTVGPDVDASDADGGRDDDAMPSDAASDGSLPSTPCELDEPFTEFGEVKFTSLPVVALDGLEDDRRPHLTPDELTIVFVSRREPSGGRRLYIADRQSRTLPFGKPSSIDVSFAADALDNDPMISADRLTLYFTSIRAASMAFDVYVARRSKVNIPFESVERLPGPNPGPNSGNNDFHPFDTDAGLWLASDRPLMAGEPPNPVNRLWFVPRIAGELTNGGVVEGIGAALSLGTPTPTSDDRALYYAAIRDGGAGKADIYLARRAQPFGPFEPASERHLTELATVYDESPGWLSPDNCRLYFERDRATEKDGGKDIPASLWVATRTPKK